MRAGEGEIKKERRRGALQDVDAEHDAAAVDAVGGVARRQHHHDHGQELGQADIAQRERIVGDVVDLPADGDDLHLHGQRAAKPEEEIKP